ncbi:phospholipase D family protein [Marinospirillum minutulum]|uniref:phospholipase D family protein n=1 Tax=Marinospirillum minutulum TaxID=64974 RepID=UPI000417982A|nr:phospholipase D family protein [Marinospirillum minutulum]
MKLVTGGNTLNKKIEQLAEIHENISFAVAWASAGTDAFNALSDGRKKIKKAVIGTHFYQTHPDVLAAFKGFKNCHFILQPQGVFHPKVFLFWSNCSWDLLIGSANLTKGAFTKNTELMLHASSNDTDEDLRLQTEEIISEYWEQGEVVATTEVSKYRDLWKAQQAALKRVSGTYNISSTGKSPIHTKIMVMSWQDFLEGVKADPFHGFQKRCDILSLVRSYFSEHKSFSEMELGVRKTIAGLPNNLNVDDWGWFGSMSGAGYYHQAVNENNPHISAALDHIPLQGLVSRDEYNAYIEEFTKAFPNGRDGIGTASRLLALKRPDQFVCLDSKNKVQLCKDFGITQSGLNYDIYWDDVICRIMDSVWWNSPKPKNKEASQVWMGRAAMLDAIFYQP